MTEETLSQVNGCFPKVIKSWRNFVSTFNSHRIHPSDPLAPKEFEFIVIDSKIQIHVIHLYPGNNRRSQLSKRLSVDVTNYSKRNSLSEEYWFMKWNKPLKIGSCNCSFRRSMRYSVISNQPTFQDVDIKRDSLLNIDSPPTKIKNVETFVERIIQETLFEAFYEYYMLKKKESGTLNLSYETTEDDEVVTLRKKVKKIGTAFSNKHSADKRISGKNMHGSHNCVHKNVQKKPLVMFLHGIGTSADIWSLVLNALVSKGYEVVAPDMLGHGFSSAPSKCSYYTFNNLVLQALTIFDHYMNNEKRKCILIGHSYGCSLITAMYPHRAQQIAQLVLISGGGPTPLAPPVKDDELPPFGCVYNFLHPLFYCGLKRSLFYSSRGKHFRPCFEQNGIPTHVLESIEKGQKWPEGDAAFHRRILVPTLLVHGLQDMNVTLVQECEMERTVPRAFLELIPNAGHLALIETPDHLIHMVTCFLEMWN